MNQSSQQSKSLKSNKKLEKCKRSLSKIDSKKSIADLLKTQIKKQQKEKELPSTSKAILKPLNKVKSGSWKRSEKQISGYNTISSKQSIRRRSPTWLKFPNSSVQIAEQVTVSSADSTSVCRPGTLYSDVLFGAGSSCLVKIKTLTPRRASNTNAQKKLTKALLKCTAKEKERCGSEPGTSNKLLTSKVLPNPNSNSDQCDVEADVIILSETYGVPNSNSANGFTDISYGNYLEEHFKPLNGVKHNLTEKSKLPPFSIDIPQWNYTHIDVSSNAYPKFSGQFEDEHYMKAEKIASLGLRLALGNNSQKGRFTF